MAIAINSKELMTLLEVTPSWQNIMRGVTIMRDF